MLSFGHRDNVGEGQIKIPLFTDEIRAPTFCLAAQRFLVTVNVYSLDAVCPVYVCTLSPESVSQAFYTFSSVALLGEQVEALKWLRGLPRQKS